MSPLPDPNCHWCKGLGLVSSFKPGDTAATMARCSCLSADQPWSALRVLVCGSRDWDDEQIIDIVVSGLAHEFRPLTLIHGAAPGADSIAAESAHEDRARGLTVDVVPFPADWKAHGRAAGPIRNQQMLVEGKPDCVIAFTDDLEASRGTRDMVHRAHKAGVLVYVVGRYRGSNGG